jgi:hypothetical protein
LITETAPLSFRGDAAKPAGAGSRIPKGSSDVWLALESEAVARRHLSKMTVYAVDTGVIPLRGTAWIDDVTPVLTKR